MLLNINNIDKYIDELDNEYKLNEKKIIFTIIKNNLYKNKELNDKLSLVGIGSYGVIINPSININEKNDIEIDNKNYVSKIFNNYYNNINSINKEYLLGIKIQKIDLINRYFIYPIKKNINSNILSNLIIKKGYNIEIFQNKLKENDIYKMFFNLLKGIEVLIENDIFNVDIKFDNILLNNIKDDIYNTVFIDFSTDFILYNKNDFLIFCQKFKNTFYENWPFEINTILYHINLKYLQKLKLKNKNINKINNSLINNKKSFINYQINKSINYDYYKKYIHIQVLDDIENNIKVFFEKVMVYQLGKIFEHYIKYNFKNYNTEIYNKFKYFMKNLTNENYNRRYDIKKIKKKMEYKLDNFNIKIKK